MEEVKELDMAELLDSEEVMAGYLAEIIQTGDSDMILSALGDIARARGMASISQKSGLNRESLYKIFRPGAKPRFDTVCKVISALGLKVTVSPVQPDTL